MRTRSSEMTQPHRGTLLSRVNLGCLQGDTPWPLLGDAHQLKQVFLNLILNACEVMPDGGLISVHVESPPQKKRSVMIRISDTGGGIPPEMLSQIFNPFFTTKRHGTGLGLAIVNRILVNHNGRIAAANEGSGAVFTVTLPLAEAAKNVPNK